MQTELVIAVVAAVPIILFPAAFVWYLTIGGVQAAIRTKKTVREHEAKVVA